MQGARLCVGEDGGEWVCLDACEDTAMDMPRAKVGACYRRLPLDRYLTHPSLPLGNTLAHRSLPLGRTLTLTLNPKP